MLIAFIADEITSFIKDHDSTWAIMQAAHENGDQVFYALASTLKNQGGAAYASLQALDDKFFEHQKNPSKTLEFPNDYPQQEQNLDDFDLVFMRKDPPVDKEYIRECEILALCKKARVINKPESLIKFNEKLSILDFPDLISPTIVSKDKEEIEEFLKQHQKVVVKPLNLMGGQGIFMLDAENLPDFQEEMMFQKYIPDIKSLGDKRIIVINGKVEGALLRIPPENDFRANLAAGGSYAQYTANKRDLEICARLKDFLINNGIYLAGIDIIGDYLTEINITSPTCLQEINRCDGLSEKEKLEHKVLKSLLQTC